MNAVIPPAAPTSEQVAGQQVEAGWRAAVGACRAALRTSRPCMPARPTARPRSPRRRACPLLLCTHHPCNPAARSQRSCRRRAGGRNALERWRRAAAACGAAAGQGSNPAPSWPHSPPRRHPLGTCWSHPARTADAEAEAFQQRADAAEPRVEALERQLAAQVALNAPPPLQQPAPEPQLQASTSSAPAPQPKPPKAPAPRVWANPACGATTGRLRRCGGCAAVRYCSEACSRAHWREAQSRVLPPAGGAGGVVGRHEQQRRVSSSGVGALELLSPHPSCTAA